MWKNTLLDLPQKNYKGKKKSINKIKQIKTLE
jgi:hypothetical protein